mgnify:CR=1 FL=1
MKTLLNIFWLGLKEIRSLTTDIVMVVFVVYAFTLAIYVQATGTSSEINNASIAFVDEDGVVGVDELSQEDAETRPATTANAAKIRLISTIRVYHARF